MELTESEKRDLRSILQNVFGFQEASQWEMNEKVLEVTAQMLQAAGNCSKAMNYVPRPGIVDKSYLKRQLRDMARRAVSGKKDMFNVCSTGAKLKWKSALAMASQGF